MYNLWAFIAIPALILVVQIDYSQGRSFTVNGSRYFVSYPLKNNWYQALRYCFNNDMQLIDITNSEEDNRIREVVDNPELAHLKDDDGFWTSGTDQGSDSREFYWMSSGEGFTYTNWALTHKPDEKKQFAQCVEFKRSSKYQWSDLDCYQQRYFICRENNLFVFSGRK